MFSEQIVPPLDRILSGLRINSTADKQLIIGGDTLPILDDLLLLIPFDADPGIVLAVAHRIEKIP